MATTRPFAYNTGSTIDGTTQIGNIAIGVSEQDYSLNPGGVKWWMGPDEELGYVIANVVPTGDHPTPVEVDSYINFWRSTDLTDQSLLDLLNVLPITDGVPPFTDANDAKTWLNDNGHFTSYGEGAPPPTPTPTPTITITPTPTSTNATLGTTPTPTSTVTSTPTNTPTSTKTSTPTPTPSVTPTNTSTPTPSVTPTSSSIEPTPTPTPTASGTATPTGFITISEVGSNVVMTASGTIDLTGLTLVTSNAGPYGGGGLGGGSATFLMGTTNVYFNEYSGFTSVPSNFGTSGGGLGSTSSSGDVFGIITQGAPPYLLVVPTGFTSGGQISSTQTFTGQTFSSLGLVAGTYTYTWGSGQSLSVVVGGVVPTPTPTPSTGSNVSAWYFYSDEGTLNVGPPNSPGNAIFTTAGGGTETFNPNRSSGTSQLYFNRYDSNGTDYGTQFNNLMTSGGSISITQNGQTATYATATPYQFQYNSASNGFLMIPPVVSQTATTSSTFVYGDPISLTFG